MPENPLEEMVQSSGGVRIFVRSWQPAGAGRAIVVICHGVNSHGGQYLWAGEQLAANGYVVFALDLRGRGKSEGERFYIDDIAEYVADVTAVVNLAKGRNPDLPVFLLGHSAGGVVSCTYALDNQDQLAGLICESFAFRVPAPGFVLSAIKWLSGFAPRVPALKLKNRDFSRDPAVVARLESDPLIANETQPAKTVAALVRADERLEREFPRITLPVFILHGSADKVTVPSGSQFFYDTVGSRDRTLKIYEGHVHDLFGDLGRDAVMADTKLWIDRHIPAS